MKKLRLFLFIVFDLHYLCKQKGTMKTKISLALIALTLAIAAACGGKSETNFILDSKNGPSTDELKLKGDKTVYGLACDGCNDSVVVLLPNDGSDPVRYNVIEATRRGKIMGQLKIGDWIGVVLNPADSTVADLVIDLDQLKGIWCYIVMPKLKDYDTMSERLQKRIMRDMPDSIKKTYLIPREYGFWMKRQWACQSVGYVRQQSSLEAESPVVYPPLGYFTAWHIWNGKLVITRGTPKFTKDNKIEVTDPVNDTCDIDYLKGDSLVLSSDGASRSYYRKSSLDDVNKQANAIAEIQAKKALQETTAAH